MHAQKVRDRLLVSDARLQPSDATQIPAGRVWIRRKWHPQFSLVRKHSFFRKHADHVAGLLGQNDAAPQNAAVSMEQALP